MLAKRTIALAAAAVLLLPFLTLAHEVYVLDPATIAQSIATTSPNPFSAFYTNKFQFFFWGFTVFVMISTIFFMSLWHAFEKWAHPFLRRLKPAAPVVERITLGLSLIAFAYNSALFGPELPLGGIYGAETTLVQIALYAAGACITLGLFTRAAAGLVAALALFSIPAHGLYMLTYTAYFVVAIVIFVMGSGSFALDNVLFEKRRAGLLDRLRERFRPYEMLALRLGFGFSVIAAAIFAKFLHSALALHVVVDYDLTHYFHFEPLFVVLGALIIETMIGAFIMLGVEIRWTAVFFLFWLTLSLLYFGEAAWPHLALFGLNVMLFCHGYDRYTLEGWLFKKRLMEPVL